MLKAERQSVQMSIITNDRLNPVWHRMLYSCTLMATVGVKGLITSRFSFLLSSNHVGRRRQ